MNEKNKFLLPVSILGISFIIGVVIIAMTWKSNYRSNQTISVTGSATKSITSDLAVLKGTLEARAATAEQAYRELENQKPALIKYLNSKGFPKDKVEFSAVTHYPIYRMGPNGYQTQDIQAYVYQQKLELQSDDVNKIKSLSIDIASLVEQGISLNVQMPEYHYTKLAELKIDMQAAAAKDAMVRAKKIAEATDRNIGALRDARMGVIQITPKLSNQVSGYGINDLSSIDKQITAVVSASFEIE